MAKKKEYASFTHLFQPAAYLSGDLADGVQARLDSLEKIFSTILMRLKGIRTDPLLTTRGKQSAIADLRLEIEKDLKGWSVIQKHYADQIRQIREAMAPQRHPRDDLVWALELQEIRRHVRSLDVLDQEVFVREAAEQGNDQALEAIEFSPIPFKLATKGLIDKIATTRMERVHPEEAAKLRDLQQAQREVKSALGSVQVELEKEGISIHDTSLSQADAA